MARGPTLNWERIGDKFYRTISGPTQSWNCPNITQWHVRSGPNGGVVVVWEREGVIRRAVTTGVATAGSKKGKLSLYDSGGRLLGTLSPDNGPLREVVVTEDEQIVAISSSGIVRYFTGFDGSFTRLRLPGDVMKVIGHSKGWMALTADGFVNCEEDRVKVIESTPKIEDTDLWAVLSQVDEIGQPLQLLSVVSGTGVVSTVIDNGQQRTVVRDTSDPPSIKSISVSPDGRLVAIIYKEKISVWSSDFHHEIRKVTVTVSRTVCWVGSDALAVSRSDDEITIVDISNGASIPYDFEEAVSLHPEVDGMRAIGATTTCLITVVPQATIEVFKIGSTAPGAILLACIEYLDKKSPQADQNLKLIGDEMLPGAIDSCITAALAEPDPRWQKRLMKAAVFGKSASSSLYDSTEYVKAFDTLRMINTLCGEPAMFVTCNQVLEMGPKKIIHRLEQRKLYPIALAVAEVMKQPVEPIYMHWALTHIHESVDKDDETVEAELLAKLDKLPHDISYAPLSSKALEEGRPALSLRLLSRESVARNRVVILMDMGHHSEALTEAAKSRNPHLVWYVLLILKNNVSPSQFLRAIGDDQFVVSCNEDLCRLDPEQENKALHDFLYQMDMRVRSLQYEFDELSSEIVPSAQKIQAFEKKSHPFNQLHQLTHVAGDWASLVTIQHQLMTEYNSSEFIGKSAAQTLHILINMGQKHRAQKLRSTLHITDRHFWWIQVRALAERRDWDALWDLAKSANPPIGHKPFFDVCVAAGNQERAAEFAELATELSVEERVRMILSCGDRPRAIDLAVRARDPNLVTRIESEGAN